MSANTLNDLTRQVTAFRTWPEFAEAMHGGYVPTLMTTRGPGARWVKAALQVDPFGCVGRGAPSTSFSDADSYNRAILEECVTQQIEMIAVTDLYL